MDLYEELGVAPDAPEAEIRAAHRRNVRKHHPDLGGDREAFERVQHAYLVLTDPALRERYDRTGEVDLKVNNDLAFIAGHIMAAFDKAVQDNPHWLMEKDLIAETRQIMERKKVELGSNRAQMKAEKAKLAGLIKRLTFKGNGPDVIRGALEQRSRQIEAMLEDVGKQITDLGTAMGFLDDYGFNFDKRAPMSSSSTSASTVTWVNLQG